MCVLKNGHMGHLYFGKRIHDKADFSYLVEECQRPMTSYIYEGDRKFSLEHIRQEYPVYGTTDYRHPAIEILQKNGSRISEFVYEGYEITAGKVKLQGLPATYTESDEEAMTLRVYLKDALTGVLLELLYTVFSEYNVIARSVCVKNTGTETVHLLNVMSLSLDLPDQDYVWMQLSGAWARERYIKERTLEQGITAIDSRRGNSSHEHNPFMVLRRKHTNEYRGEAIGFSLIYSGNFRIQAEVDTHNVTRITAGINPKGFDWKLEAGEMFQTPEAVMVYSESGLNGMSQTFHKLYGRRLARGYWRDRCRPILINNWEATYFGFDTDKLLEIAREAKKVGIEMLVMDDGWFGKRDDDNSGLGDWVVNEKKLPGGLKRLVDGVNEIGLKFGIWFEPEMVSEDSDLYRAHPDWALKVPGHSLTRGRNQLVLDFSRADVRQYIFDKMSEILESANIEYVKWDANRHMTDVWSAMLPAERQGEVFHRYILGLYDFLEKITHKFPDVLFEGCSGGGGRFDAGMMYYHPQIWCSDDTDAIERLRIQYGTSFAYPISTVGSHVSVCPNHQTGRSVSMKTRGVVAMSGTFGYELDITEMSEEDKNIVREQVEEFKKYYNLIQQGEYYRLSDDGTKSNYVAWQFVSEDQKESLVNVVVLRTKANPPFQFVYLRGLKPEALYHVEGTELNLTGAALMNGGYLLPVVSDDYEAVQIHLTECD